MPLVTAANILEYQAPESVLVYRMVQNIHPRVRSCLVFVSEPKSIKKLYSLASQVAESRAIDNRRQLSKQHASNRNFQQGRCVPRTVSMAVGGGGTSPYSRAVRCWKCSGMGHVRKDCPFFRTSVVRNRGNVGKVNSLGVESLL